jgi:hypothetical protein
MPIKAKLTDEVWVDEEGEPLPGLQSRDVLIRIGWFRNKKDLDMANEYFGRLHSHSQEDYWWTPIAEVSKIPPDAEFEPSQSEEDLPLKLSGGPLSTMVGPGGEISAIPNSLRDEILASLEDSMREVEEKAGGPIDQITDHMNQYGIFKKALIMLLGGTSGSILSPEDSEEVTRVFDWMGNDYSKIRDVPEVNEEILERLSRELGIEINMDDNFVDVLKRIDYDRDAEMEKYKMRGKEQSQLFKPHVDIIKDIIEKTTENKVGEIRDSTAFGDIIYDESDLPIISKRLGIEIDMDRTIVDAAAELSRMAEERAPNGIAKIITEDIRTNNGLCFDEDN